MSLTYLAILKKKIAFTSIELKEKKNRCFLKKIADSFEYLSAFGKCFI